MDMLIVVTYLYLLTSTTWSWPTHCQYGFTATFICFTSWMTFRVMTN